MKYLSKTKLVLAVLFSISSLSVNAETRTVGNVTWQIQAPTYLHTQDVPKNMSQLVFVRFNDNLPSTTSANISVDNDYHISLLSNHLTQVRVCTGPHTISTQTTANKSNDLAYNPYTIQTDSAQTYYFQVKTNEQGSTSVSPLDSSTQIDGQSLTDYLIGMQTQTHQVSRVVLDCPTYKAPAPVAAPIVEPESITVELDKPINLAVLFEFDSAKVQPVYNQKIEAVANFLQKYPDTITIIEGHTDNVGSDKYNMNLSQQRADAVKQELVSNFGIAAYRLNAQGFGETRPVDTNATPEGRDNNRRVVATVRTTK